MSKDQASLLEELDKELRDVIKNSHDECIAISQINKHESARMKNAKFNRSGSVTFKIKVKLDETCNRTIMITHRFEK